MVASRLKIKKCNHVVIITSSQRLRMINKVGLPFRMKVPQNYHIQKQAELDSRAQSGHGVGDTLAHETYQLAINNETNGNKPFWIGWQMYWAGYARGIRTQRQAQRIKKVSAFDLISDDDIQQLSTEIGVSSNVITNAVMEIISKSKTGGVA